MRRHTAFRPPVAAVENTGFFALFASQRFGKASSLTDSSGQNGPRLTVGMGTPESGEAAKNVHTPTPAVAGVFMNEVKALEAIFPGTRRLLFAALFGEPERWWSVQELAGRAGVQPSSLRVHIGALRNSGIVREKNEENRVFLQADPSGPVFAELRAIVRKLTPQGGGAETILVVEDQPATAQITRILLESWGYTVLEAHGGLEALHLFEAHGDGIQLLLSDVLMPDMNGPQLAEELRRRHPGLRVIFMSGYPSEELRQVSHAFLPKPFNPASLAQIVRRELDRRAAET